VMTTAPQLFGESLDETSPALELILRTFRAADVDGNWHLSIVEFQTLLAVVTYHQSQILKAANPESDVPNLHVTLYDSEKILRRLNGFGSFEITVEQWVGLCVMDTEDVTEDDDVSIPNCDGLDEKVLARKVFDYLDFDESDTIEVADYAQLLTLAGFDPSPPETDTPGARGGRDRRGGRERGGGKRGETDPCYETLTLLAPTVDFDEFYSILVLNDFPDLEDESEEDDGEKEDAAQRKGRRHQRRMNTIMEKKAKCCGRCAVS